MQEIKFEAFDKDIDSDDFLGRCVSCWLNSNLHHCSRDLCTLICIGRISLRYMIRDKKKTIIEKEQWFGS